MLVIHVNALQILYMFNVHLLQLFEVIYVGRAAVAAPKLPTEQVDSYIKRLSSAAGTLGLSGTASSSNSTTSESIRGSVAQAVAVDDRRERTLSVGSTASLGESALLPIGGENASIASSESAAANDDDEADAAGVCAQVSRVRVCVQEYCT